MSILQYRTANNYNEYLKICAETFTNEVKGIPYSTKKQVAFDSVDEWTDFFGIYEFRDEKYDDVENWEEIVSNYSGDMDLKPDESEYPVLVTYQFEDHDDRFGDVSNQLWDWISLKKINLQHMRETVK